MCRQRRNEGGREWANHAVLHSGHPPPKPAAPVVVWAPLTMDFTTNDQSIGTQQRSPPFLPSVNHHFQCTLAPSCEQFHHLYHSLAAPVEENTVARFFEFLSFVVSLVLSVLVQYIAVRLRQPVSDIGEIGGDGGGVLSNAKFFLLSSFGLLIQSFVPWTAHGCIYFIEIPFGRKDYSDYSKIIPPGLIDSEALLYVHFQHSPKVFWENFSHFGFAMRVVLYIRTWISRVQQPSKNPPSSTSAPLP